MSHVFLSYAREDQSRAEIMAGALEALGHQVWWDRDIRAGSNFGSVIGEALDEAACVVVLWSRWSVESNWVLDESSEGLERKVLVPVLIDDVKPPLGFRRIEAANLVGWSGSQDDDEFRILLDAIELPSGGKEPGGLGHTDGLTKLPPPEPVPERGVARSVESIETDGAVEALRGRRVRIVHSESREREARAALQALRASGATAKMETMGLGVNDVHRSRV